MSTSAAQFQFAAEFVSFLAAAAGLALVLLRGDLVTRTSWGRTLFALGFTAMATAAFLHGSLVVDESAHSTLAAVRAGGLLAVAVGSISWRGSRITSALLWLGLGITGIGIVLGQTDNRTAANVALGAGALAIAGVLAAISRRSIAARVAASAAGTLLMLVLVLSVALSAVLSRTSEREAVKRLDDTAATEATLVRDNVVRNTLQTARYAAAFVQAKYGDALQTAPAHADAVNSVRNDLEGLARLFPNVGFAYLDGRGTVLAATLSRLDQVVVTELSRSSVVDQTTCPAGDRSSVEVAKAAALAIASYPECTARLNVLVGKVLAVTPLNDEYLQLRSAGDNGPAFALLSNTAPLAATGPGGQPSARTARRLADRALADAKAHSTITDTHFVVAQPVFGAVGNDTQPVLALVAATPTSSVAETRDSLFRALFLIALGGTLLALFLAALVGDRIGAGLRRLTRAAEAIQRGETGVRTGITADDEVGVLGATFDSMAESIEDKTGALRQAADDETRLRNRLEAVVAGMSDALVAVDADGRITDFNQSAEELTGVSAAAARGRSADEVLTITGEDGSDLAARASRPSPTRWDAIGEVPGVDGHGIPVAVSSGALRGPASELAGTVLVLRDLRREREIERMKTEFLSRVGHELRTPLTGILGYSEILLRREVEPERRRLWYEEIIHASKRLLRIVEMLEFVASAGAGRVLLRPEHLDVRTVVDTVVSRWSGRLDKPYSIGRRVARGLPPITADRRWLTLSLDELVDNAVKFSPDGGKVMVSAAAAESTNGKGPAVPGVEISVTDRGKGMSELERAEAFGDFVQGDSSDTRSFGGLGLGLGLVKRVVEGHGGTVTCESEPNKGSKFTIFIPTGAA